jgi:hypothetical protein
MSSKYWLLSGMTCELVRLRFPGVEAIGTPGCGGFGIWPRLGELSQACGFEAGRRDDAELWVSCAKLTEAGLINILGPLAPLFSVLGANLDFTCVTVGFMAAGLVARWYTTVLLLVP